MEQCGILSSKVTCPDFLLRMSLPVACCAQGAICRNCSIVGLFGRSQPASSGGNLNGKIRNTMQCHQTSRYIGYPLVNVHIANWKMAIEIVDFPIEKIYSYVSHYQRVNREKPHVSVYTHYFASPMSHRTKLVLIMFLICEIRPSPSPEQAAWRRTDGCFRRTGQRVENLSGLWGKAAQGGTQMKSIDIVLNLGGDIQI